MEDREGGGGRRRRNRFWISWIGFGYLTNSFVFNHANNFYSSYNNAHGMSSWLLGGKIVGKNYVHGSSWVNFQRTS